MPMRLGTAGRCIGDGCHIPAVSLVTVSPADCNAAPKVSQTSAAKIQKRPGEDVELPGQIGPGSGGKTMNRHQRSLPLRPWWASVAPLVVLGAVAFGPAIAPALADDRGNAPAIGDTTVFATVPAPGSPFGVAVDRSRVYVSTSAGDFFADPATGGHLNSDGERVFAYDNNGNLVTTTSIATMPNSNMGLFGLALDGNPTPDHHLYVADMNGRILRLSLDHDNGAPVLFAKPPLPGGWMPTICNHSPFARPRTLSLTAP